jgi:hypothetical protein
MYELIAAYNRVDESSDLIGNHNMRIMYISLSVAYFGSEGK